MCGEEEQTGALGRQTIRFVEEGNVVCVVCSRMVTPLQDLVSPSLVHGCHRDAFKDSDNKGQLLGLNSK